MTSTSSDTERASRHTFSKRSPQPRPGYFALEAAGLEWLAGGGLPCATVLDVGDDFLTLGRLTSGAPTAASARAFGQALACTHDAGAEGFGSAPPVPTSSPRWSVPAPAQGWATGWFGPLQQPLELPLEPTDSWGDFYGGQRLEPMVKFLRDANVGSASLEALEAVIRALRAGRYDDDDSPVRAHGDLWSGNLMFTAEGAVVIDPAAHGDHREQDLAFLHLFGAPYLEEIVAGYESVHPLRAGWRGRTGLHQLFVLAAHAVLFDPPGGGSYLGATQRAAHSALNLLND